MRCGGKDNLSECIYRVLLFILDHSNNYQSRKSVSMKLPVIVSTLKKTLTHSTHVNPTKTVIFRGKNCYSQTEQDKGLIQM